MHVRIIHMCTSYIYDTSDTSDISDISDIFDIFDINVTLVTFWRYASNIYASSNHYYKWLQRMSYDYSDTLS